MVCLFPHVELVLELRLQSLLHQHRRVLVFADGFIFTLKLLQVLLLFDLFLSELLPLLLRLLDLFVVVFEGFLHFGGAGALVS